MTTLRIAAVVLFATSASAQVTIDPESPQRGQTVTITAAPKQGADPIQSFYKSDQLYAILSIFRKGLFSDDEWTELKWDGTRFVGKLRIPEDCLAGKIYLTTNEKLLAVERPSFLCRDAQGSLVPGALIFGLRNGARDVRNWKADVDADLAKLADTKDSGWIYQSIWALRDGDLKNISREELLGQVEALDQTTTGKQDAAILASLVYGFLHANEPAKAFAKLKEVCERFPESPYTVEVALHFAMSNTMGHGWTEYQDQLRHLRAQVANAAPDNPALRRLLYTLTTDTPGVSIATLKHIATAWTHDEPQSMRPHFVLGRILSTEPNASKDAEESLTKAIELSYLPHPFNSSEDRLRNDAYRTRSKLRAERGDLAGAIADAKMAQLTETKEDTSEDVLREAELWGRLGYADRSEAIALGALGEGSLRAEGFLKQLYVSRTGGDEGFAEHLIAGLRAGAPLKPLRRTPVFTATTLDGRAVDATQLRRQVTVVDFWFINCPGCRVERPILNKLVEDMNGRVQFVGFALDPADHLNTYLKAAPFKFEVVPDCKKISNVFGVQAYPTHLLIDQTGAIVWESTGGRPEDVDRLRAMIYRVLARSGGSPETLTLTKPTSVQPKPDVN